MACVDPRERVGPGQARVQSRCRQRERHAQVATGPPEALIESSQTPTTRLWSTRTSGPGELWSSRNRYPRERICRRAWPDPRKPLSVEMVSPANSWFGTCNPDGSPRPARDPLRVTAPTRVATGNASFYQAADAQRRLDSPTAQRRP